MATKIKVLQFAGPRKAEVVEDTLGDPREGQLLVKTLFSGISHGTEMNVYRGDAPMWNMSFDGKTRLFRSGSAASFKYPIRYGYVGVGRVQKIGPGVSGFKEGDLVFCESPHASASLADAGDAVKLPEKLDPKVGIFLANLRTTLIGTLDAGIRLGECVTVFGQGTLGQLLVQWARRSGARPVVAVDLNETRLRISREAGKADHVINPSKTEDVALAVKELTGGRGADIAIEVSASDRALEQAIRSVCYNGRVIVLSWYPGSWGNVHPGREFHHNRVQLICSQTCGLAPELSNRWTMARATQTVVDHMGEMNLAPLISHLMKIEQAPEAYRMIDEGRQDVMQIVFQY